MTIDQIEKELDANIQPELAIEDFNRHHEFIKSFYRQKITELLEELAKEAIGEEKADGWGNTAAMWYEKGYYDKMQEVISAFERRGIKI